MDAIASLRKFLKKEEKRTVLVTGFPGSPTNVKASVINGLSGVMVLWHPPADEEIHDLCYSVWISTYEGTDDNAMKRKPRFTRVYSGTKTKFVLSKEYLTSAFLIKDQELSFIFRVAARNHKGHGPSAKIVWKPGVKELSVLSLPLSPKQSEELYSKKKGEKSLTKKSKEVPESSINKHTKRKSCLIFCNDIPSDFETVPTAKGVKMSWSPPRTITRNFSGYQVLLRVEELVDDNASEDSTEPFFVTLYKGPLTSVVVKDDLFAFAHIDTLSWPVLTFRIGTYDSKGRLSPTAEFQKPIEVKFNKDRKPTLRKWVLQRETLKNSFMSSHVSAKCPVPSQWKD